MSVTWNVTEKTVWPNLEKDFKAERLAKLVLGWDFMTTEQRENNSSKLIAKAQQIKETL